MLFFRMKKLDCGISTEGETIWCLLLITSVMVTISLDQRVVLVYGQVEHLVVPLNTYSILLSGLQYLVYS